MCLINQKQTKTSEARNQFIRLPVDDDDIASKHLLNNEWPDGDEGRPNGNIFVSFDESRRTSSIGMEKVRCT